MFGRTRRIPDIERLKREAKTKELIEALSYTIPYPIPGQNVNQYTREVAEKSSLKIQISAAKALAEIEGEIAIDPLIVLIKRLENKWHTAGGRDMLNFYVEAKKALSSIKKESAITKLVEIAKIRNESNYIREACIQALGNIGSMKAVKALMAIINDFRDDDKSRMLAVEAISSIGYKDDIKSIIDFYNSIIDPKLPVELNRIISAMAKLGQTQFLIGIMMNSNDKIEQRKRAAQGLKSLGWKSEQNEIGATFSAFNSDWDSCIAIGSQAVEPLIFLLSKLDGTEESIVSALGEIGDRRAVDPFFNILDREYTPLYNAEMDGEIYSAGYAEMDKRERKYLSLRNAIFTSLNKLREKYKDEIDTKAKAHSVSLP